MKKIMFISFPVAGHVNPQLYFCKELAEKNVKLIYYTLEKYYPKFEGIENIELRSYPDSFLEHYNSISYKYEMQRKLLAILYMFYTLSDVMLPFMLKEVEKEKPDLIICDSLSTWGKIVAEANGIPYANFFSSLMGDEIARRNLSSVKFSILKTILFEAPYIIKIGKIRKMLKEKYGVEVDKPTELNSHGGVFSMVMTSKEFHPGGDEYPDYVKFIGPAHVDDSDIKEKKDTIFISLGTIYHSSTFWDICLQAVSDLGYKVVISFGGNKNNRIDSKYLSDNVKVYDNLTLDEYKDVLRKSALFISHGGFNSVSDGILYRTPVIICPGHSEQVNNGKLLEICGCGLLCEAQNVKVSALRKKALKLLNDKAISENLEKYRLSFINSLGYKGVVEELNKEFNLY